MEHTADELKSLIDASLDAALPPSDTHPELLHKAMRYGVFPGGKRIRPLLVLATAKTIKKHQEKDSADLEHIIKKSIPPATAIELIHSYSLIHDDLPSMDDDEFRRGIPTVHSVFGEAEAILAGDALLSLAFETVSKEEAYKLMGLSTSLKVIYELALASGSLGMVGGQIMDVNPIEHRERTKHIEKMSDMKTGALIKSAIRCGAIVAGANCSELEIVTQFGELFGRAFQVRDDLLDFKEDGVFTFPQVLGKEEAAQYCWKLVSSAVEILEPFGTQANDLFWLIKRVFKAS